MKNILKFLILCGFITSCSDPLDVQNSINKHLDAEIANRIVILTYGKENKPAPSQVDRLDPQKIDEVFKGIVKSINLYDASYKAMSEADAYFGAYAQALGLDKEIFVNISSLDTKPEVIVAIKLNELVVLDRLLVNRMK